MIPERIVSGGQTGVDRAALDFALAAGIPCGGVVPKGRLAEDGRIPGRYPVAEGDSPDYAARTEQNAARSDATLVIHRGSLSGGTLLTVSVCRRLGKPCRTVDLELMPLKRAAAEVRSFLVEVRPRTLNIAGPRESKCPGIHRQSLELLRAALKA